MKDRGAEEDGDQHRDFVHHDPVVDQALDWFSRLREREPDAETRAAFRTWLNRDPRHALEFQALEAIWGSTAFADAVESSGKRPASRLPRSRSFLGGLAIAASLIVAVAVWQYPALMIAWEADYVTATGDQSTITLPDGSSVTLNTATAVAVDFEDGRRNVRILSGEAYFDVKYDEARPFTVTGQFATVEVKGTAFSVRSGRDADDILLERGKVEVRCLCAGQDVAELVPGDAVSATATALSGVRIALPSRALAWREGRIAFEEARLGDVLAELRRYYSGAILVVDDRVNRLVVTGNYRLDNVEGAIRTLADAAGVGMTRIPGGLIILR